MATPRDEVLQQAERDVISGTLVSLKAIDRVTRKLEPSHILDATLRNMLSLILSYVDHTGTIPSPEMLAKLVQLQTNDVAQAVLNKELADSLLRNPPDDGKHQWSTDIILEHAQYRQLKEALRESTELLARGNRSDDGLPPHVEAREMLSQALSDIDRIGGAQDAPAGSTHEESESILTKYLAKKDRVLSGVPVGVPFGIPQLDRDLGGMQEAELILIAALPKVGKSHFCVQAAWNAVTTGFNIVFISSETVRDETIWRLLARHSAHLTALRGEGKPLNTKHLRSGTLTDGQEALFRDTLTDWSTNTAYGDLYLAQIPEGGSLETVRGRAIRANRRYERTLIVIDYITLLKATKGRGSAREEIVDTLRASKNLASAFDGGRGISVLSPWQISRDGGDKAVLTGRYTLKDMAESSEAEKTADKILAIWRPEVYDDPTRVAAKLQVLGNRNGETGGSYDIMMDYRCSKILPTETAPVQATSDLEELIGTTGWSV